MALFSIQYLVVATSLLASMSWAQQLEGYNFPLDILGLSDDCFSAVNTTVSSCPAWLAQVTGL
jgi:hypothetical protein